MKQVYGIDKIEALKFDNSYKVYIGRLLKDEDMPLSTAATNVMAEYRIKSWLKPVVMRFIETGKIDPSLSLEPVRVERDGVYGDTKLVLAHDITQPILKQFINDNWSNKIQPKVNVLPKERHTVQLHPERDKKIFDEYLQRHNTGYTVRAIAYKYNVSESTVKRIVRSKKKA